MNSGRKYIQSQIDMLLAGRTSQEIEARLSPDNRPVSPSVPGGAKTTESAITERWALLQNANSQHKATLLDPSSCANPDIYSRNIEGFIGTLKVPVGLAGPLRVNGAFASGDYYIPLATTEAAMVASYSRGAQVISEAGGCASLPTRRCCLIPMPCRCRRSAPVRPALWQSAGDHGPDRKNAGGESRTGFGP